MPDDRNEGRIVSKLIEAQRQCSESPNPFERVVGSLLMAARLQKQLSALPDETIGQLMRAHLWNLIDAFSPEMTICQVATERLLNSSSVVKITRENLNR